MKRRIGPQQNRSCAVILSDAETARVQQFVVRCGKVVIAQRRLGLGRLVLDNARDYGRMQATTRDRVLEALAREEATT